MKCPLCKAECVREIRPITYTYQNRELTLDQPGEYCTNKECGESFHTTADLQVNEAEIREKLFGKK